MSKKKAAGKTSQHVNPVGKRLGVKVSHGEAVGSGAVLVRQRGTRFHAGKGVRVGRDHTLFAVEQGVAKYGKRLGKRTVSVA